MNKIALSLVSWLVVAGFWCLAPANKSGDVSAKSNGGSISTSSPATEINDVAVGSNLNQPNSPPSTKRLKIQIDLSSIQDLKVIEGQTIHKNQLIADHRQSERTALKVELDRVRLSIEQLKLAPKVAAIPPAKVRAAQAFSKASYAEELAAIASAKSRLIAAQSKAESLQRLSGAALPESAKVRSAVNAVTDIERSIGNQQRKIDALKTLEDVDLPTQDHERIVLEKLNQSLTEAKIKVSEATSIEQAARDKRLTLISEAKLEVLNTQQDIDTAQAKLAAAIDRNRQVQADRQAAEIDREDRVFRTELERIKLSEVANLQSHDRAYQLGQLQLKKSQLEHQIGVMAGILAPFDGTIRRVKLIGQNGNLLKYEIALTYTPATVSARSSVSNTPRWEEQK